MLTEVLGTISSSDNYHILLSTEVESKFGSLVALVGSWSKRTPREFHTQTHLGFNFPASLKSRDIDFRSQPNIFYHKSYTSLHFIGKVSVTSIYKYHYCTKMLKENQYPSFLSFPWLSLIQEKYHLLVMKFINSYRHVSRRCRTIVEVAIVLGK